MAEGNRIPHVSSRIHSSASIRHHESGMQDGDAGVSLNDLPRSDSSASHTSQAVVPPGILAIYHACSTIYKSQPNPLQVTAVQKYWLDGPDPLDYISMYENPGDATRNIPPHWHYVSLGLSDLHGDGRIHERSSADEPSGYGFELTLRLKRENGETSPPTWPAVLMQALAKYVFQSDNILQGGDHVSWHSPLDDTESRIRHMLMAEDAQLSPTYSPFGYVNFIQIVGVCAEELKASQHWNGPGVLELLRNITVAGGPWLITDMRRGETIFEIDPTFQEKLEQGIEQEGSNLSGVSGLVQWEELETIDNQSARGRQSHHYGADTSTTHLSATDTEKIKTMLEKGLRASHHQPHRMGGEGGVSEPTSHLHSHSLRRQSADSNNSGGDQPSELVRIKTLDALHIKLNAETGSLLPLALRGRLKHGRHFTFKSTLNDSAVTLLSPSVVGAFVDEEHRFAVRGSWLQVLLDDDFTNMLAQQLDVLSDISHVGKPEVFSWPERGLSISILPDVLMGHT